MKKTIINPPWENTGIKIPATIIDNKDGSVDVDIRFKKIKDIPPIVSINQQGDIVTDKQMSYRVRGEAIKKKIIRDALPPLKNKHRYLEIKRCKSCHREYVAFSPRQKYCYPCQNDLDRERMRESRRKQKLQSNVKLIKCFHPNCDNIIEMTRTNRKWCSDRCRIDYKRKIVGFQ